MSWKHVLPVLFLAPAMAIAQGKAPSDPQIAGIVVTANQIDIDAGKLAKASSKTKEVQDFAQQMITDHTAVNKQAAALAQKLGVTPEESDTSKSLKQAAADTAKKLKSLKGGEFDKAYAANEVAYHQQVLDAIDKVLIPSSKAYAANEVAYHQQVLDAIDKVLIPSAQNAELKDLIVKVRPAIAAHLEHARHLQASLGKKK